MRIRRARSSQHVSTAYKAGVLELRSTYHGAGKLVTCLISFMRYAAHVEVVCDSDHLIPKASAGSISIMSHVSSGFST